MSMAIYNPRRGQTLTWLDLPHPETDKPLTRLYLDPNGSYSTEGDTPQSRDEEITYLTGEQGWIVV